MCYNEDVPLDVHNEEYDIKIIMDSLWLSKTTTLMKKLKLDKGNTFFEKSRQLFFRRRIHC